MGFNIFSVSSISINENCSVEARGVLGHVALPESVPEDDAFAPLFVPYTDVISFRIPKIMYKLFFGSENPTLIYDLSISKVERALNRILQETPFALIPPKPIPLEGVPPFKRAEWEHKTELQRRKEYMEWQLLSGSTPHQR